MPNNSPYPGYDFEKEQNIPFDEKMKRYFFSRENDIEAIKYRLRKNRVVILISKPQMGKTSILKAGVIPALQDGFMANFRNKWLTPYISIVGNPYKSLAAQLVKPNLLYTKTMKPEFEQILQKDLQSSIYSLGYICEEAENLEEHNLLVTIDDFDQLFENDQDPKLGLSFLETLYEASQSNNIPFSFIISLTLDGTAFRFIQRDFPELISSNSYFLHRLSEAGLMDAIIKPLKKDGVGVDDGLWRRLVEDLYFDEQQLPKLQKSMALTWKEWKRSKKGDTISYKDFSKTIGKKLFLSTEKKEKATVKKEKAISPAQANFNNLQNEAEKIYRLLDDHEKAIITKVFKSITRYQEEDQVVLEHASSMGDIVKIINVERQEILNTIEFFGNDILSLELISDKLSISDVSFLSEWDRIKTWAMEEYKDSQTYLALCEAASKHFREGIALQDIWSSHEFKKHKQWLINEKRFSKEWGLQYSKDFELAVDFIEKGASLNIPQPNTYKQQTTKTSQTPKRKKIVIKRKGM